MTKLNSTSVSADGSPANSTAGMRNLYVARVERFQADRQRLRRILGVIWTVLLASGVALLGTVLVHVGLDVSLAVCGLLAAVALVVAIAATPFLLRTQYEIEFAEQLAEVNSRSLARVDRDWHAVPVPNVAPPADRLALSQDLDLFGRASLCQLICRARTPWGLECVGNWMTAGADADTVCKRQAATRELMPQLEYRQ